MYIAPDNSYIAIIILIIFNELYKKQKVNLLRGLYAWDECASLRKCNKTYVTSFGWQGSL